MSYTDPSGHWFWAAVARVAKVGAMAYGAYSGWNSAKKKGYTGWRKAASVAWGVASWGSGGRAAKTGILKVARKVAPKFTARVTTWASKKATRIIRRAKTSKIVRKILKKPSKKKPSTAQKKQAKKVSNSRRKDKGGQNTGNSCFVAGTRIATANGLLPIEQIRPGDMVWAEDPETGEVALKEVVETYIHEKDKLIQLTVDDLTIDTTEEHPFWVESQGWTLAGKLKEGDLVRLKSGKDVPVQAIKEILPGKSVLVYNFQVEDFHTYFVSDSRVLVHNKAMKAKPSWDNKDVSVEKQLTGAGQLKNLRNNKNLDGVNINELIKKTPRELEKMQKDGKITKKVLTQIKKCFQGRDLGKKGRKT